MVKKEDERIWNLVVYDMYATDKELDEIFSDPWFWLFGLVLVAAILSAAYLIS